ncbi:MAG: 23S rRNA (adenine(1618)-N(6))-methyltransferase RlmF [Flavobacteriaceae bacterium]|nr:23S rRNA (adenine(1618)-N(6))-methyltransferase RlmF [Flavobacteriaceae bacterium]
MEVSKFAYNFTTLSKAYPALKPYVFTNKFNIESIDFSNAAAVKALNKAILISDYQINYWEFPDENLCPPIPGRAAYIKLVADLLNNSISKKNKTILDIGTGATCIYPILGNALYQWKFIATDVDQKSLNNAQIIIDKNKLNKQIELRLQSSSFNIFKNIILENDKFSATICNPPFYSSQEDADKENRRKHKGLSLDNEVATRNFSGTSNELWIQGGEISFIKKYVKESFLFKNQCFWFTILVSKKENIRTAKVALKKLNATDIKTIPMDHGNKKSRIIAWTFLSAEEQKQW